MTRDPLHLRLADLGYWVFPCFDRNKCATYVGGRKWGSLIDDGEQGLAHGHLLAANDASGWAICLQPADPHPLLLLDIDAYGTSFEDAWALVEHGPPPEGLGVTRSASGGWHLWFALPPGVPADKVPPDFDLGNGAKGEIRVSGKARRLLMLPGSEVGNKFGKIAKYEETHFVEAKKLPEPPATLMARLLARSSEALVPRAAGTGTDGMATEAHYALAAFIDELPAGEQNIRISRMGQILGRIGPAPKPSAELLANMWARWGPDLDGWAEAEFHKAVHSGYQTGRRNADEYTPRDKHPTVTDARVEGEALFGGPVWLAEVRDSAGKTRSWIIGIGGSEKRRDEADKQTAVDNLTTSSMLSTLARLSGADKDSVVRSPLFIQGGWSRVFMHDLMATRAIDILGVAPEERFWTLLSEWTKMAANDGHFLPQWSSARPPNVPALIHMPPTGDPIVAIMPTYHDQLQTRVGDYGIAKKLCKAQMKPKKLGGMSGGKEAWLVPVGRLDEDGDVLALVKERYTNFLKRKTHDDV